MPTEITTASKAPVTIRAASQTRNGARSTPPDGAAAARPTPRLIVTRATAPQVRRGRLRWKILLDSSSVNGSSMMKIGCTRATGPLARATAWHTAATMISEMPASHTLRLIR